MAAQPTLSSPAVLSPLIQHRMISEHGKCALTSGKYRVLTNSPPKPLAKSAHDPQLIAMRHELGPAAVCVGTGPVGLYCRCGGDASLRPPGTKTYRDGRRRHTHTPRSQTLTPDPTTTQQRHRRLPRSPQSGPGRPTGPTRSHAGPSAAGRLPRHTAPRPELDRRGAAPSSRQTPRRVNAEEVGSGPGRPARGTGRPAGWLSQARCAAPLATAALS